MAAPGNGRGEMKKVAVEVHRGGQTDPLVVSTYELGPILDQWLEAYNAETVNGHSPRGQMSRGMSNTRSGEEIDARQGETREGDVRKMGGVTSLEFHSGISARAIWRIRTNESKFTSLTIADALLTAIDQVQAFHDGRVTIVPNPGLTIESYHQRMAHEGRSCSSDPG